MSDTSLLLFLPVDCFVFDILIFALCLPKTADEGLIVLDGNEPKDEALSVNDDVPLLLKVNERMESVVDAWGCAFNDALKVEALSVNGKEPPVLKVKKGFDS